LGDNPYTDKQLILTAVRHLLTTGLYIRAFEDWDQLSAADQTWFELRRIIQDAFERRLNATAPTAGHQGYAPALPYMHNPPTYIQAPMMPTTYQHGYGSRGRGRGRGRSGRTQQQYSPGGFPPTRGMGGVFPPTYAMPPPTGGGVNMYRYAPQGGIPGYAPHGSMQPQERPQYSNLVKRYANWNACYTCGFDVPDGHTSMTCQNQRKVGHDVYFTRQNAQQYIDAGRNCSTRYRHRTQFPAM